MGKYPIIGKVLYIPGGAGLFPSTICMYIDLNKNIYIYGLCMYIYITWVGVAPSQHVIVVNKASIGIPRKL